MTHQDAFQKLNNKMTETVRLIREYSALISFLQTQLRQSKATKKRVQKLLSELDSKPPKTSI